MISQSSQRPVHAPPPSSLRYTPMSIHVSFALHAATGQTQHGNKCPDKEVLNLQRVRPRGDTCRGAIFTTLENGEYGRSQPQPHFGALALD